MNGPLVILIHVPWVSRVSVLCSFFATGPLHLSVSSFPQQSYCICEQPHQTSWVLYVFTPCELVKLWVYTGAISRLCYIITTHSTQSLVPSTSPKISAIEYVCTNVFYLFSGDIWQGEGGMCRCPPPLVPPKVVQVYLVLALQIIFGQIHLLYKTYKFK